ncbi:hypothetical protein BU14_0268s0015 [Porphyra umbilicalis]|uniref:Inositol-1-monophosphatase n=1 Tax=Porphyra umbilicalis TaxID=2786 RepID=A0A1X6P1L6_PORUM|nr:hypothetical protein BU14_0268s0015 [Porphyra umbilicalis]|eukprot:OSX74774.1 hypothetical protein BU14_0268s0015 [Porphyra umbilicalis]
MAAAENAVASMPGSGPRDGTAPNAAVAVRGLVFSHHTYRTGATRTQTFPNAEIRHVTAGSVAHGDGPRDGDGLGGGAAAAPAPRGGVPNARVFWGGVGGGGGERRPRGGGGEEGGGAPPGGGGTPANGAAADGGDGWGGANAPLGAGPTWVADPLDGTANFVRRCGAYAVSLGWMYGGWVLAGVIVHVGGPVYAARVGGGGATINGAARPARVSTVAAAADATVLVEFGSDRSASKTALTLAGMEATLAAGVMAVRSRGSAALNVAAVGAGAAELYWEWGVWPWDIAAGLVFVREAGGAVGLPDGRDLGGGGTSRSSAPGGSWSATRPWPARSACRRLCMMRRASGGWWRGGWGGGGELRAWLWRGGNRGVAVAGGK